MISNLLPGLRELRTPLAAGLVWLAALVVLFADDIPTSQAEAPAELRNLWAIGGALGPGPMLAALAFVAYLVGSVWEGGVAGFRTWRSGDFQGDRTGLSVDNSIVLNKAIADRVQERMRADDVVRTSFADTVAAHVALEEGSGPRPLDAAAVREMVDDPEFCRAAIYRMLSNAHQDEVLRDLHRAPTRLLGREPEIWSSWDRIRTEGEFRLTLAIPVAVLVGAAAVRLSWWLLLCLPFAALLLWFGIRKSNEADSLIIEAVRAGRVDLVSLESIWPRDAAPSNLAELATVLWNDRRYRLLVYDRPSGQRRYVLRNLDIRPGDSS